MTSTRNLYANLTEFFYHSKVKSICYRKIFNMKQITQKQRASISYFVNKCR